MLKSRESFNKKIFNKKSLQIEEYEYFCSSYVIFNYACVDNKNKFFLNYALIGKKRVIFILLKGSKKEEFNKKIEETNTIILDKINSIINNTYIFMSPNLLSTIKNNNFNIYNKILSKNFENYFSPKCESKIIQIKNFMNVETSFQMNKFKDSFFHMPNDFTNIEPKTPSKITQKLEKDNFKNKDYKTEKNLIRPKITTKNNENSILYTIKEKEFELTGFKNIGHSCYMNSFLQILLRTPNFIKELKIYHSQNTYEISPLIETFFNLLNEPNSIKHLKKIKTIMAEIDESYGRYIQNDSQMFGIHLISFLIYSIKDKLNESQDDYSDDDDEEIINDNIPLADFRQIQKNRYNNFCKNLNNNLTFLEKMFGFYESSIKFTDIKNIKRSCFENMLNINLFIPNTSENYSLEDLLNMRYSFLEKKPIDEKISLLKMLQIYFENFIEKAKNYVINLFKKKRDEKLPKVKKSPKLIEIIKIASLPKILIISINRAIIGQTFHTNKVKYKKHLDLSNYVDYNLFQQKNTTYELYAVNECCSFSKNSGHYYSFVKANDGGWYKFDDESFEPIEPNFNSNFVVGLYYIRKDEN